jgi:hypothetical protein
MERRLALSAAPGGIEQVAAEVAVLAKKAPDSPAWSDGPVVDFPSFQQDEVVPRTELI